MMEMAYWLNVQMVVELMVHLAVQLVELMVQMVQMVVMV
jgi:hypothetical protein